MWLGSSMLKIVLINVWVSARLTLLLQFEFRFKKEGKTGEIFFLNQKDHAKFELVGHKQNPVVYAYLRCTKWFLLTKDFAWC